MEWYNTLSEFLKDKGFTSLASEPCIFVRNNEDYISCFVDDICYFSTKDCHAIEKMLSKQYKLKVLGPLSFLLGIKVHQTEKGTFISQPQYIKELLETYEMSDCKPSYITGQVNPLTDENATEKPLRSVVGSLLHLALATRPDIAFAVTRLGRRVSKPTKSTWQMAIHVLRYLKGTSQLGIYIKRATELKLEAYADADLGGSTEHKSTSGILVLLNKTPVIFKAKTQRLTAESSTESELIALAATRKEVNWIRNVLAELNFPLHGPTTIFQDCQPAIAVIKRNGTHQRTKHLSRKIMRTREEVAHNRITIEYLPTDKQIADIFTKCLPQKQHLTLAKSIVTADKIEG
eukprot:Awhi_evm2s8551